MKKDNPNQKRKGGRPKQAVKREERIQVRTTKLEKKILEVSAGKVGLTVSEYLRARGLDLQVKERFSPEELELFQTLQKFHRNFTSLGNYIRNTQGINPMMLHEIDQLKQDIHEVIKRFK